VLGAKNRFNYAAWKNSGIRNGTGVFENNGVTLTANSNDCYTSYDNSGQYMFPINARIPVSEGEKITLTWKCSETENLGTVYIFPNGSASGYVSGNNTVGKLEYTVTSGVTYLTHRFGVATSGNTIHYKDIMVKLASDPDDTYAPYAMTNRELTDSTSDQKTAINAIITAATGAADFAAFKAAMGAITPVTRSLLLAKEDITEEVKEDVEPEKTVNKKRTTKKTEEV
jgi:hypothetical protein